MKRPYNCPNCGAPIESEKCAYCGTVILDFAALQVGAPTYAKIKLPNGTFIIANLLINNLDIEVKQNTCAFYDGIGARLGSCYAGPTVNLNFSATAVRCPEDKALITIIEGGGQNEVHALPAPAGRNRLDP